MQVAVDVFFMMILILFPIIYYKKGLFGSILGFGRFALSLTASIVVGRILKAADSENAFSGALAAFLLAYVALTALIFAMKHIDFPLLTKFDKLLGLILGLGIGLLCVCLMSTVLHWILDIISRAKNDVYIMDVYNSSRVFKLIYDLRMLEYIRNLI